MKRIGLLLVSITFIFFSTSCFAVERFMQATLTSGDIPTTTSVGTTYTATYTITNVSTIPGLPAIPLSGMAITPAIPGATLPANFNTCIDASLSQGQTCTLDVVYTPTTAGSYTINVNVNYLGDQHPIFISTSTTTSSAGITGAVFADALPANMFVGQSKQTTIRFTNNSSSTQSISSVLPSTTPSTDPNDFTLITNTCGSTLPGVGSGQNNYCDVTGQLKPTAALVGNDRTATITLNYGSGMGVPVAQTVDVHSTTAAIIDSTITANTVPTDSIVGQTYEATVKYTNISDTATATINSVTPTTSPSSTTVTEQSNTCGATLAPLASCTAVFDFAPVDSFVGSNRQLIFTLTYDTTKTNVKTITTNVHKAASPVVAGSVVGGQALPAITTVNTPATTQVSFTDTGGAATTASSVTASTTPAATSGTPFTITNNGCASFNFLPNSGNSCTVTAQFTGGSDFENKEIQAIIRLDYESSAQSSSVSQTTNVHASGSTGIKAIEFNYPIPPFTPPACPQMSLTGVVLPLYVYKRDGTSGAFTQLDYGYVTANSPTQGTFNCLAPATYVKATGSTETQIKFFAQTTPTSGVYKSCVVAVNSDGSINTTNTTCAAVGVPTIRHQGDAIGLGQIFDGTSVGSDAPPAPRDSIIPATRTVEIKNDTDYAEICVNTTGDFSTSAARLTACTSPTPNASGDVLIANGGASYTVTVPTSGNDSIAAGVIGVELPGASTLTNANFFSSGGTTQAYQTNLEWTIFPDAPVSGSGNRVNSVGSTNADISGVNGTNIGVIFYPTTGSSTNFCAIGNIVGYFDQAQPLSKVTTDNTAVTGLCESSALQPNATNPIACASPCSAATINGESQDKINLACCQAPFATKSECDNPSTAVSDYSVAKYGLPPKDSDYVKEIDDHTLSYYSYAYDDDGADFTCDPATSFVFDLVTPG